MGQVNGGNTIGATAVSTLELATGNSQGILNGLGEQFVNFASVVVDPAALWSFRGQNSLAAGAALLDQGSLALDGELTVDGTVTNSATLLEVADTGNGRLVVENQGSLISVGGAQATSGLQITQTNGLSGDILVTGTNSLLSNAGRFLVGNSGAGSLEIEAGATVVTTPFASEAGLVVANLASASGSSVNVTGTQSTLQVGGLLVVGNAGSGALSLSGGATVTASSLDAGNSAAAVGQISLTGTGTALKVTGDATVADDGTGVLSVLSGATFSATNLTIGALGDSSGALVVSGAGSVINLIGALNIGTALGVGDLTIGPGGAVHAAVVNLQGQVVLEGGNLDPTVTIINQGQTAGGNGTLQAGDIIDEGVIQAGGTKPSQKLLIVQGTVIGGGTLTINGTVQPSNAAGVLQINAAGTLELTGPVLNAATTTFTDNLAQPGTYTVNNSVVDVTFADAAGVLLLDDIAGFAGTVTTYHSGDAFVITGGTLSGLGVVNGTTLTVHDSGTGAGPGGVDRIMFGTAIDPASLSIVNGNTIVACFAAGTRIETASGAVGVEDLAVGDLVLTQAGSVEPIVWLGSRLVDCARHPAPETVWPVRVAAGAFGSGRPGRDLYLSPDHAVFVDGVLVPVRLLVNGSSIVQVKRKTVTYHHVELPDHAVILAEGLAVESYLDVADRTDFAQGGDVIRLFPRFNASLSPNAALEWETRGAAPLVVTGPELASAREAVAPHISRRPSGVGPDGGPRLRSRQGRRRF